LRDLRELVLLEKSGSLTARPVEVTGLSALECCAAQLGEMDRLAPGARHPLRLARQFLLRGLETLPEGEEGVRARKDAGILGSALTAILREGEYFLDVGAMGTAMSERGLVNSAGACYDLGCFSALAAAAVLDRKLKVLGERDEDVAGMERELKGLTQEELAKRAASMKDLAFAWLNRAVELGFKEPGHTAEDTDLTCLHDDPRFEALLAKMK
jgi:hypothetical protein